MPVFAGSDGSKPCDFEWNGVGAMVWPVTGLVDGYFALNTSFSKVWPFVSVVLPTM